ncbi:uncharacterized protein LOC119349667 [Triticum dicoccoides]|uniref:uncharacterized protein LOC119349667 n=1 Tax=Triticum dicoccoides TaxID=85692 RepID=UPI00188F1480|nr:uncharacterized protein LOC119349667 [Triticum dicoccoides]
MRASPATDDKRRTGEASATSGEGGHQQVHGAGGGCGELLASATREKRELGVAAADGGRGSLLRARTEKSSARHRQHKISRASIFSIIQFYREEGRQEHEGEILCKIKFRSTWYRRHFCSLYITQGCTEVEFH